MFTAGTVVVPASSSLSSSSKLGFVVNWRWLSVGNNWVGDVCFNFFRAEIKWCRRWGILVGGRTDVVWSLAPGSSLIAPWRLFWRLLISEPLFNLLPPCDLGRLCLCVDAVWGFIRGTEPILGKGTFYNLNRLKVDFGFCFGLMFNGGCLPDTQRGRNDPAIIRCKV